MRVSGLSAHHQLGPKLAHLGSAGAAGQPNLSVSSLTSVAPALVLLPAPEDCAYGLTASVMYVN